MFAVHIHLSSDSLKDFSFGLALLLALSVSGMTISHILIATYTEKIPSKIPRCQEILPEHLGQQKTRKPYLASGFKLLLDFVGTSNGGGGGS